MKLLHVLTAIDEALESMEERLVLLSLIVVAAVRKLDVEVVLDELADSELKLSSKVLTSNMLSPFFFRDIGFVILGETT